MNPLFARELRARWRDRRAWWLVLVLTIALAFLAYAMFFNGVSRADETVPVRLPSGQYSYRTLQMTPSAKAARAGRELFMALAMGNVVAWLLVAPILTATPIARERERGLLESLQLSHMTPRSQIAARVGAALVFLLFLQLAVAPIYGTIFWLGGVSPGEFALAGLIISLTALGGISVGTWISARSHRPSSALFTALGFVVLWTVALVPAGALMSGAWFGPANFWSVLSSTLATALFWSHPLPLIWAITDTSGDIARLLPSPFGWDLEQFALVLWALWSAVSFALLVLATRAVKSPLAPATFGSRASKPVESWRSSILRRQNSAQINAQNAAPNASPGAAPATPATSYGAPRGRRIENTLVADVPIEKLLRFANPLLEREVRARFRLRRGGVALMLGRLLLLLLGLGIGGYAIYALMDDIYRAEVPIALIHFLWIVGALAVGALASAGFARERESGTWEALKLSLLRPLEIVRAKWLSPLWAFFLYSLPLWLIVPFGADYYGTNLKSGLNVGTMALSVGIVVLSLGTISMVALLVSWRAKQPNTALGWVLGLGLFLFVAVPILREATDVDVKITQRIYGVNVQARPWTNTFSGAERKAVNCQYLISFWHPITALTYVQDERTRGQAALEPVVALEVQLAVFVLVGGGGALWLRRAIARDRDSIGG